jgi:hypothetical protein
MPKTKRLTRAQYRLEQAKRVNRLTRSTKTYENAMELVNNLNKVADELREKMDSMDSTDTEHHMGRVERVELNRLWNEAMNAIGTLADTMDDIAEDAQTAAENHLSQELHFGHLKKK